jgi:hypothetical protein
LGEHDRQIEFAGQQVDAHLVGEIEIDVEGCPGQDGAKPRDPIGDVVGGEIVLDADAHRLVEIAGALHRSAGFVPLVTQSSCMVEQPVSRRRWLGAGTAAGEQLLAEHGFSVLMRADTVDCFRFNRSAVRLKLFVSMRSRNVSSNSICMAGLPEIVALHPNRLVD